MLFGLLFYSFFVFTIHCFEFKVDEPVPEEENLSPRVKELVENLIHISLCIRRKASFVFKLPTESFWLFIKKTFYYYYFVMFCRKLKYIVAEMIETERDYVKSLEYIMAVSATYALLISQSWKMEG